MSLSVLQENFNIYMVSVQNIFILIKINLCLGWEIF